MYTTGQLTMTRAMHLFAPCASSVLGLGSPDALPAAICRHRLGTADGSCSDLGRASGLLEADWLHQQGPFVTFAVFIFPPQRGGEVTAPFSPGLPARNGRRGERSLDHAGGGE